MMMLPFILFIGVTNATDALPLNTQSYQLQQLIEKSEAQLEELKQVVKEEAGSRASLQKASNTLEMLSAGIDESIKKYQGTKAYSQALLELQSTDDFSPTYLDTKQLRQNATKQYLPASEQTKVKKALDNLVDFQKESVRANKDDLKRQQSIQQALETAKPGVVPKLLVEAQLGTWQANTRISAQLTELLSTMHSVREELRVQRLAENKLDPLGIILKGTEIQNAKQRGAER